MYEYRVKVRKVVDGDTVDVDIDLGFGVWLRNERVRLYGIDTPESRTRDLEEKKYGKAAKARLKELLELADEVHLRTEKDGKGKFGRILGSFWGLHNTDDPSLTVKENINMVLVEEYHAVEYYGQSKEEIQEEHLKNRLEVKL